MIETNDAMSLKLQQTRNHIDKLIEVDAHVFNSEVFAMQELIRLIGNEDAWAFYTDKLRRKIAQNDAESTAMMRHAKPERKGQKASPGKKTCRNHTRVG